MPDNEPIHIGNIGAGDNGDWIKLVDGGKWQRQDLAASHANMVDRYLAEGQPGKAAQEQRLLDILRGDDPERETTLAEHYEIMARYYAAAGKEHSAAEARERQASYRAQEQDEGEG